MQRAQPRAVGRELEPRLLNRTVSLIAAPLSSFLFVTGHTRALRSPDLCVDSASSET